MKLTLERAIELNKDMVTQDHLIIHSKNVMAAMEAMARQPESAGNLRTSMIIAACMVEGAALFAIIVALLAILIQ